jgi:hypothetical protein
MRLYPRMDAAAVDDPEHGHFEPGEDGGFPFPDELSDRLLKFHYRGKPAWEADDQRAQRMHGGVGYARESGIHAYLKRAALNRDLFGSPAAHRARLAGRYRAPYAKTDQMVD